MALLARFLRLRPIGHRAHETDVLCNATIKKRQRGRDAETRERAAAADHEVETIVEAEHARISVHVARAIAAATGAPQVDGTIDVLRGEARVLDRKPRGFRRNHAFGAIR